jgi:hypothetical protein
MEDHLRNKDRLDEEWQAMCGYEAESSTSLLIASKVLKLLNLWNEFVSARILFL